MSVWFGRIRTVGRRQRQVNEEFAAVAGAGAARLDPAAVHLDQAAHQRQADPQAPLGAAQGPVDLGEHVEHPRQHVGGNADAGVSHRDHHFTRGLTSPARHLDTAPDLSARIGILGGVVEQVGDHLGQAHGVGVEDQRRGRQGNGELVAAGLNERLAGFDGAADDRGQLDRRLAEFDLAAGDARDFQQVIDQADHVIHLPFHHLMHALDGTAFGVGQPEEMEAIADQGEQIAQLMGQHRQEFVFAAVGVFQCLLHLLALGDVHQHVDGAD